jgi:hypothetical protein
VVLFICALASSEFSENIRIPNDRVAISGFTCLDDSPWTVTKGKSGIGDDKHIKLEKSSVIITKNFKRILLEI